MDAKQVDKLSDDTILAAKRFLQIHKPPAPMTDLQRLRTKAKHLRTWLWKHIGVLPEDGEIIDDPSPELARRAGLTRDGKHKMRWGAVHQTRISIDENRDAGA